jgi:hypothetical protein
MNACMSDMSDVVVASSACTSTHLTILKRSELLGIAAQSDAVQVGTQQVISMSQSACMHSFTLSSFICH